MSRTPGRPLLWVIFRKDLLEVLRDRRAMFFAFVVPILIYPVLFLSFGKLSLKNEPGRDLKIACSGDYRGLLPHLSGAGFTISEAAPGEEALRRKEIDLHLEFPPEAPRASTEPLRVIVRHSSTSPPSEAARRKVIEVLERYRDALIGERLQARGIAEDPRTSVVIEKADISNPDERASSRLGKLLPVLLVILLFTGGSFAAIDLVAGEKERGTLETLYLHPVPARDIVGGKFLVILAVSFASLAVNLLGVGLSFALGIFPAGMDGAGSAVPGIGVLGSIGALAIPLAVLTSAVLLALSSYASSFREAQTYLLPLTLVAMVAVFLAGAPQVSLSTAVAVVPVANVALAIRESLEGKLQLGGFLLVFTSSSLYAGAALWKASSLLGREDIVLGLEPPSLATDGSAQTRARRVLFFGAGMILFLSFAGSWVQARDIRMGLLVTLWVFVLIPALVYPLIVGSPLRETLGLRAPRTRDLLLAPVIALASFVVVAFYAAVQSQFLPFPAELEEVFRDLFEIQGMSGFEAVFLLAISPAICEEILWRGTFQGELEPRGKALRTMLTVGLYFGVFHLSAYRIVPTAIVGCILACVRHRTGSLLPCMLIHALYNSSLLGFHVLEETEIAPVLERFLETPLAALLAAGALYACLRALRRGGGPTKATRTSNTPADRHVETSR
jgi:sodium transport system permease protein